MPTNPIKLCRACGKLRPVSYKIKGTEITIKCQECGAVLLEVKKGMPAGVSK